MTTEVTQCMSLDDFHAKPIMKIYQAKGKKSKHIRISKKLHDGLKARKNRREDMKARSVIQLQRGGRRMNVNDVDGQDAEHFAQVKYADLQRYARPTIVKSQGWWNCSQSYATLTYITASEIKSRQELRIVTLYILPWLSPVKKIRELSSWFCYPIIQS